MGYITGNHTGTPRRTSPVVRFSTEAPTHSLNCHGSHPVRARIPAPDLLFCVCVTVNNNKYQCHHDFKCHDVIVFFTMKNTQFIIFGFNHCHIINKLCVTCLLFVEAFDVETGATLFLHVLQLKKAPEGIQLNPSFLLTE